MCNGTAGAKVSIERELLSRLILRALNRNQLAVLLSVFEYECCSISSILRALETESGIPLSTLKLNASILKRLQLIDFGGKPAELTAGGAAIVELIAENANYKDDATKVESD